MPKHPGVGEQILGSIETQDSLHFVYLAYTLLVPVMCPEETL